MNQSQEGMTANREHHLGPDPEAQLHPVDEALHQGDEEIPVAVAVPGAVQDEQVQDAAFAGLWVVQQAVAAEAVVPPNCQNCGA